MRHSIFRAALWCAATVLPIGLAAQEPLPLGSGRTVGPPTKEVTYQALDPDAITRVKLNMHYFMVMEFPSNIKRIDVGDHQIAIADIVENKMTLKPTKYAGETNMTVWLDDANLTTIPFMIESDTTAHPVYKLSFIDPVVPHVREAEMQIEARLENVMKAKEGNLFESMLRNRLVMGIDFAKFDAGAEQSEANIYGELVTLKLVKLVYLNATQDRQDAYLFYQIGNLTSKPLESPVLRLKVKRALRAKDMPEEQDIYDVQDSRAGAPIPAGTHVDGVLSFDRQKLTDRDQYEVHLTTPAGVNLTLSAVPQPSILTSH